jgi:peptide/nickel transport system substrate-binding protein
MNLFQKLTLIFMLSALLLAACSAPQPPSEEQEGGRLVRAMTSEPSQIDPQGTPSSGLSLLLPYLFDTLVVRDIANNIQPLLAKSWNVSEDGKEITFQLKESVTFHDGTDMNADAVVYTFERFKEVGTRSPIYGGVMQIKSIEAVDDLTVRFTFDQPTPNFWGTISMAYASIISPQSVEEMENTGEGHVVGSGPFQLESWEAGQQITLERNPDYTWGPPIVENQGPPHLAEYVYKIIPDATTQFTALKAGEVDVLFINQPSHWLELQKNKTIKLNRAEMPSLVYLGFNNQKPPLDETLVRQALSHAVDKDEIVELALSGMGNTAYAPLPPTLQGVDPSLKEHEQGYDPALAREKLSEAGFTQDDDGIWTRDGEALEMELLTSTRDPNGRIAILIQSQLKAIGVPVTIQQLESRAVMKATSDGAFDLLVWRLGWNGPDALNIFFTSERIGRTNRVGYSNPEVDELLEQADHELDDEKRLELYQNAQEIILKDAAIQPLYNPVSIIAIRDQVQGAQIGHMGRLLVNDISLESGTE